MGQPSSCCAAKHGSKPQNFIIKSSGKPRLSKDTKNVLFNLGECVENDAKNIQNMSFLWTGASVLGLDILEKTLYSICEDLKYDTVRTLNAGWFKAT